jgi:predicted NBD/HSP70 family sugar kinase
MATAPQPGRALTSARIRRYHYRVVLERLRRLGEASKADLARAAQLTNTAIGQIVADLHRLGLIAIVGKRYQGQRGQPATMLRLEPTGAYGIGVRLDRHRVETALVDLAGRLVARRSHLGPLPPPALALHRISRDIAELRALIGAEAPERVLGIGLARPFNLGAWLDRLDLHNPDIARWDGFDFAGELGRATGLHVHEENDGTAAAIAELFYGFGRDRRDFLYLFLGAAIGGGVILDGDYRRGATGNAGDVAVMPVAASALPSAPPAEDRPEILLARASIAALLRHLGHCGVPISSPEDLPNAIAACPEGYAAWLADCVDALVGPILAAHALLDVPDVVIDGDLDAAAMGELVSRLQAALARAAPEAREPPAVRLGSFGSDAHALGAASLPLFIDFAPRAGLTANARDSAFLGGADVRLA